MPALLRLVQRHRVTLPPVLHLLAPPRLMLLPLVELRVTLLLRPPHLGAQAMVVAMHAQAAQCLALLMAGNLVSAAMAQLSGVLSHLVHLVVAARL